MNRRDVVVGPIPYDELNHSELVDLAMFNEIPGASRAVPRHLLVRALKEMRPIASNPPLGDIRKSIHWWITEYWDSCRMSALFRRCPQCMRTPKGKTPEARSSDCPDPQTAYCFVKNKNQIT